MTSLVERGRVYTAEHQTQYVTLTYFVDASCWGLRALLRGNLTQFSLFIDNTTEYIQQNINFLPV